MLSEQPEFFCDITKQINGVYEEYAKSVGLSYTSLYVLHMIALSENCTQKYIAEQMYLPKQTINSVISAFCKQGLVELTELPEDRRHKGLHLTEKGHELADKILPQIERAEHCSMAQFNDNEKEMLFSLIRRYAHVFSKELVHK